MISDAERSSSFLENVNGDDVLILLEDLSRKIEKLEMLYKNERIRVREEIKYQI